MPAYDKLANKWTMPFVMQPINTRVVRRSNALLGHLYGEFKFFSMKSPFIYNDDDYQCKCALSSQCCGIHFVLPVDIPASQRPCDMNIEQGQASYASP